MKFENIYSLCKKHCDDIIGVELISRDGYIFVDHLDYTINVIGQLVQIDYLKDWLNKFFNAIENIQNKEVSSSSREQKDFREIKEKLIAKMETIISLYESMGLSAKKLPGLDMRIPDCDNFTDFKKMITEIEFIITKCPFTQHEAETLRFEGVDVGSQWISFAVSGIATIAAGSILLNNIAAFVDKCIIIRSHYLTTKQQKQEIERASIEQGEKDELLKNINRIYKIHIENVIKELEEKTGCKISDGDERGRAEQSLQKMGELIDKGLRIYSSIDSPKETKALFEPLEMKYLSIEQELKAIEDKKNKQSKKEENDK